MQSLAGCLSASCRVSCVLPRGLLPELQLVVRKSCCKLKPDRLALAGEEQLAEFTPSFLWLLRDFYLTLEEDGRKVRQLVAVQLLALCCLLSSCSLCADHAKGVPGDSTASAAGLWQISGGQEPGTPCCCQMLLCRDSVLVLAALCSNRGDHWQ